MTYDTKSLVAIAALLTDEFGYRKDFGTGSLDSTKAMTRIMYTGLFGKIIDVREQELYDSKLKPLVSKSQAYMEKADKVLNWIRNFDTSKVTSKSEFFMAKMKYAVRGDEVFSKDFGYVACLPNSYNKHHEEDNPVVAPKISPITGKPAQPKIEPKPIVEPPKVEPTKPVVETPKVVEPKKEEPLKGDEKTVVIDGMTFGNVPGFMPTENWMRKRYEEFNNKYFEGKLPDKWSLDFKISTRATNWAGQASCLIRRNYGSTTLIAKKITLAVRGLHTEKHTCEIFLHEMIHIWQFSVRHCEGGHGYDFIGEMNRINKYGWNVEKTESLENQMQDVENPTVKADFLRLKMLAITKQADGQYRLSIIPKASLNKFKNYAHLCIQGKVFKAISFYNIKDATPFYKGYKTNNINSGFAGYRTTEEKIKEWLKNGQIRLEAVMGEDLFNESTFEDIYRLSENVEKCEDKPIAKVGEMYITDCKKEDDGSYEIEAYIN